MRPSPTQSPLAPLRARDWAGAALVLAALIWAYAPAERGGFIWDDSGHLTAPELRSTEGLGRIWFELGATQQYYPLLHTAFWVEHRWWGDNPLGYHWANLLLHAGAAFLAWQVLRRLAVPGAGLAAALFALHPVQVESVAWISEQKNTLSAIFYLGALLAYLRFDDSRRRAWYAFALVLFLAGLCSKTVTATLPAALLVIFWWKRGRLDPRGDVLPLLPFFLLGAGAGLLTAWFERALIGAQGADFALTFAQRATLGGRALWFYAGRLLWPAHLSFVYPRWDLPPGGSWGWPLTAVAVVVALWRGRKRARGPLAAVLLFAGTLFPVLGFFNVYPFVYSFVADHFQYLASLALLALAAAGLAGLRASFSPVGRFLSGVLMALLPAGLALLTWQQCRAYSNVAVLYRATLIQNPSAWLAHDNLGLLYAAVGRAPEARMHFAATVALEPDYFGAYNNLGILLFQSGQTSAAAAQFQAALRLRPADPETHNNLGNVLYFAGDFMGATRQYAEALRLRPDYPEARANLQLALRQLDRVANPH